MVFRSIVEPKNKRYFKAEIKRKGEDAILDYDIIVENFLMISVLRKKIIMLIGGNNEK